MAHRPRQTVVRLHTTIIGENKKEEARERLLREFSWRDVSGVVALLYNRHAELQEKIEQLQRSLQQPCLPVDLRDSIIARIKALESLSIETSLSKKVDLIDSEYRANATDAWSEMIFVAQYADDEIRWRSVEVIVRCFEIKPYFPFIRICEMVHTYFATFNRDSFSHFQNMPVPPPAVDKMLSCTQVGFAELLTKGCFVSITQHISPQEEFGGGLKWIKLGKRLINALESCGKFLRTYLRDLKSSFVNCATSLKSTQKSQRAPCQSYSDSIDISLMEITPRHSLNCFFYLFSLLREKARNRILEDET